MKSYDRSKWEKVRLGNVSDMFSGGTPLVSNKQFYDNGNIPFIRSGEISSSSTELFITEEGLLNSSAKTVYKGDLLLALYGATSGNVAISQIAGAINQAVLCIRSKFIHPGFLCHLLTYNQSDITAKYLQGGQGNLSAEIVKSLVFRVPNKQEQLSIAKTLDMIHRHISNLEKLISKQESIKKSTINLLLKPKADWVKKTIGDVCSFFTSSSKSAYIDPDGRYFIVDMGAVSDDGTLIAQKRTNYAHDFLHKNDLIMPKDDIGGGNIIGKAVAIQENDKYILSDHVYKLQTELDATFLSYLINSPKINKYMRAMATGSAQLGISKRTVSKCELCFPADLGQQKAIAQKLGAIDEHINNLKQQLKKQQDLKQGLMQYFFGD